MFVIVVLRYDPYFDDFVFFKVLPLVCNLASTEKETKEFFRNLPVDEHGLDENGCHPRISALIYNDQGIEMNRLILP